MSSVYFQSMLLDIKEKTENSAKVELESLREQVKRSSKHALDIQGQLMKLEIDTASTKAELSTLQNRLNSIDSFSSRLTVLENKVSRILKALEAAGISVDPK